VLLKSEARRLLNTEACLYSQSSPVHMGFMGRTFLLGDCIPRASTAGLQVSIIQSMLHVNYSTYYGRYINIAKVSALNL